MVVVGLTVRRVDGIVFRHRPCTRYFTYSLDYENIGTGFISTAYLFRLGNLNFGGACNRESVKFASGPRTLMRHVVRGHECFIDSISVYFSASCSVTVI